MTTRTTRTVLALCMAMVMTACAPVAFTAMGVGMSTGVAHTLGGIVYKTFTVPQGNVEKATYGALSRMQIKVTQSRRDGSTKFIRARAGDREVEVELEALTPNTTRMMVTARKDSGLLRDGATATEIILQTEKIVGPT